MRERRACDERLYATVLGPGRCNREKRGITNGSQFGFAISACYTYRYPVCARERLLVNVASHAWNSVPSHETA